MAAVRANQATTLKITRITGSDETGKDTVGYLNFSSVNPEIADDDLLAVGKKISNLRAYTVKSVGRLDSCTLAQEH